MTAMPVAATDTTTCTGTPDSPAALIAAILTAPSKPNMDSNAALTAMPDPAGLVFFGGLFRHVFLFDQRGYYGSTLVEVEHP